MTPEEKIAYFRERTRSFKAKREEKKAQIASMQEARKNRIQNVNVQRRNLPCVNEGAIIEWCNTCQGDKKHVRECDIYEKCTHIFVSDKVKSCDRCTDYKADETELPQTHKRIPRPFTPEREHRVDGVPPSPPQARQYTADGKPKDGRVVWAYGVTTVPERRDTLLPHTLFSLKNAGFDYPRLFVDGCKEEESWRDEYGLDVTARYPKVRTYGNWILSLGELYIRNPMADRYVIFQDDIIAPMNLRKYLERCVIPDKGYLNLITYPQNEGLRDRYLNRLKDGKGWYPSNQAGKGAQGLVFTREVLFLLLTNHQMIHRITDLARGWRNVDGAVAHVMKRVGYTEYVHSPSLLRHTGLESAMGNKPQPKDISFPGEQWDALESMLGVEAV